MHVRPHALGCGGRACLCLAFLSFFPASQALAAGPNQFVILSDTQTLEGVDQLTREVIDLGVPFVVSVGDVPSSFDAKVNHFRRLREAGMQIHIAMGNHDEGPKALVRSGLPPYPLNDQVDPALRFAVENKYYYSFNRGGIHFVIVDTCTDDKEAEIEWLEADLIRHVNNPDRLPSLLFMHYPEWMLGQDAQNGGPIYRVLASAPDKHTVKAAFAGHTHKGELYPAEQTMGIPLYTLHPSAPFGKDTHTEFVLVTVKPDELQFERKIVLEGGKAGGFKIQSIKGRFGDVNRD